MGDVYRGRDLESGDLVAIKVLRPEVIAADPGVVALFHVDQEQGERALELYGLASRYPYVSCSRWYEDVAGRHIAAAAAGLPPDVIAAAQERGRARDLEATLRDLLVE